MHLNDKLVDTYPEGFSGVYIHCDMSKADDVVKDFNTIFEDQWHKALVEAEEEYGIEPTETGEPLPANAVVDKDRVYVNIEPLYLTVGSRADNIYGVEALINTLREIETKYNATYDGLLAYEWSDEHCGDVVNEEIHSEGVDVSNIVYDFVRVTLNNIFNTEALDFEFWEDMGYNFDDMTQEDVDEIVDTLKIYDIDEDIIRRFTSMADEYGFDEGDV